MVAKIESNVPVPDRGLYKPLLLKMRAGQSLLLKDKPISVACAWQYHIMRQHPERKFTARTVKGGTRIWRIK